MINATGINQVWVANGTYTPGATLSMKNGVAICGGFVGTETTLTARTLTAPPQYHHFRRERQAGV